MIKPIIKSLVKFFGYEFRNIEQFEQTDDPYHVLSLILESDGIKTIIDGGASIGDISQKLSYMFPCSTVYAIEPYPVFHTNLEQIASENKKIQAVKIALSDKNGSIVLKINKSEGTNSLLRSSEEGSAIYGDLIKTIGEIEVKSQMLDTFIDENSIEQVDLLKLDLQGSELPALLGASKSLSDGRIKCILCEIMFHPHYEFQPSASAILHELMDKYDYKLFNLYQPHHHHGYLCQADALLLHSSISSAIKLKAQQFFHPNSNFSFNA